MSDTTAPPADPRPTPQPVSDPIVEVRDLVVHFGDVRAVDGVSLDIQRGSIYGLLGPNGAGKTTLIRVLATLLRPDSGTARVSGVDVLTEPTRARAHIGLAGQFAAVDPYQTGRENVRMVGRLYGLSRAEARRRTDDVLERINLTDAERIDGSAPTRVACGGDWTSRRRSSAARR